MGGMGWRWGWGWGVGVGVVVGCSFVFCRLVGEYGIEGRVRVGLWVGVWEG